MFIISLNHAVSCSRIYHQPASRISEISSQMFSRCILQFTSIFLQVSLYSASHFPTLSAHYHQAFNMLLRLLLNATHKKHVHYSFVYFNPCIPRKKLKQKTC